MKGKEARDIILDIGRRMYTKGFVAANDGNISVRVGENEVWATPTGVSKGFMTEDMLVKLDLNGNILKGERKPSSEIKMHLRAYRENAALNAVCHAHPPIATAYAAAGRSIGTNALAESVLFLGTIPVAPYAELGTDAVADSIAPYVLTHPGVLLANHGLTTWAEEPYEAFYRMESIEHVAQIQMILSKKPLREQALSDSDVEALRRQRTKFGLTITS